MKSGWAMALDLVYKVFEAFVVWRKANDDWFNQRRKSKEEEMKQEAEELLKKATDGSAK
jgi:hypothetical protein